MVRVHMSAVNSPSREYVYSGSQLLAKFEAGSTTYFHPDHLSNRVMTDSTGAPLGQRAHYPFGETWYESGTTSKLKFTSYEHDSETQNEFAMARYDVSRLDRFSSPDPIAGSASRPQFMNRYAYAGNDPVNSVDPSGLFLVFRGGDDSGGGDYGFDPTCGGQSEDWGIGVLPGLCANYPTNPTFPGDGRGLGGGGWRKIDRGALDLCTRQLFGVGLVSFTDAQGRDSSGERETEINGSFTGVMAGIYQGRGKPLAPGPSEITVTSDLSMSVAGVTASYNLARAADNLPPAAPNTIGGYTNRSQPFINHVAGNMTPDITADTQLWELGNSLAAITGKQTARVDDFTPGPTNTEAGNKLLNCYNSYTYE